MQNRFRLFSGTVQVYGYDKSAVVVAGDLVGVIGGHLELNDFRVKGCDVVDQIGVLIVTAHAQRVFLRMGFEKIGVAGSLSMPKPIEV